jgi:hypothetical protein
MIGAFALAYRCGQDAKELVSVDAPTYLGSCLDAVKCGCGAGARPIFMADVESFGEVRLIGCIAPATQISQALTPAPQLLACHDNNIHVPTPRNTPAQCRILIRHSYLWIQCSAISTVTPHQAMARSLVACKPRTESRTKVKTGCVTCRSVLYFTPSVKLVMHRASASQICSKCSHVTTE